ncbi:MAG: tRNA (adenosine(37)-N6)-threonylcarbamoyltransferase complex ATPase subunit type 1 TsaE [Verrucomicrobia bacterium]|nr:MAG: tRNA (adenosine(37)-N6)-threonylcarbamoyltransferase complex ATPase subunit type 1 TsaE [Verrucomicrobiota bacterium]
MRGAVAEILRSGVASADVRDTLSIAEKFAGELSDGAFIALYGDLGAGKTAFVKGLAAGLGIAETVKSPSFNICAYYAAEPLSLVHVDAYRLGGAPDFENLMIDEFAPGPKVVCVEWPQAVEEAIPSDALRIRIECAGNGRVIRMD